MHGRRFCRKFLNGRLWNIIRLHNKMFSYLVEKKGGHILKQTVVYPLSRISVTFSANALLSGSSVIKCIWAGYFTPKPSSIALAICSCLKIGSWLTYGMVPNNRRIATPVVSIATRSLSASNTSLFTLVLRSGPLSIKAF